MSRRIYTLVFGWPLSVVALFFIGKILAPELPQLLTHLQSVQIYLLLLGIFFFLVYFFLRSYAWQKILTAKGHDVSYKTATFVWAASELKRYIPGNIWSLLGRSFLMEHRGISQKETWSTLLLEAEFLVMSFVVLLPLGISYLASLLVPQGDNHILSVGVTWLIIIGTLIFLGNNRLLKQKTIWKLPIFKLLPHFSFLTNLEILCIATLSSFCYVLGSYLVASSLFYLHPLYLLTFLGIFAFTYLVGYLSFITPMGLGIREGALVFTLSRFLSVASTSFIALYLRIMLIAAELLFVGSVYLWEKTKRKTLERIETFVTKHRYLFVVAIGMALYVAYFVPVTIQRHNNFYTGRFDLGNMDQVVWNTMHGRMFQMTNSDGTEIISRLFYHADFILILLAPFYRIWSDPRMLLIIQTLVLACGAVFVYLLAAKLLNNKAIATVFSFVYLFNLNIQYTNLYEFHAVTFATTFFLGAWYFLLNRQWKLLITFLFLAAITKEEIWLITGLIGLYLLIFSKKRFLGPIIAIVSFAAFYYLIWYAIPQARGGGHFALSYYSDFGSSPSGIVKNILFSPDKTIGTILQKEQLDYLLQIFLPIGLLPVISPLFLIFASPDLLINLLSNNAQLHQIYYQYTAAISPFLFIAALYGVRTLQKYITIPPLVISLFLLGACLYSAYSWGPLPGAKSPNLDMITKPYRNAATIERVLAQIPHQSSVSASNNLGAHLSHRQRIYTMPLGIDKADYIAFLLDDPFAQPSPQAQQELVNKLKQDSNYSIAFEQDKFIVFRKIVQNY